MCFNIVLKRVHEKRRLSTVLMMLNHRPEKRDRSFLLTFLFVKRVDQENKCLYQNSENVFSPS